MQTETVVQGELERSLQLPLGVRVMTANDIDWLWDKARVKQSIFFEPSADPKEQFKDLLLAPDTFGFIVDDGALCLLTTVVPGHLAFCNVIAWQEGLTNQIERARELMRAIFRLFQLCRMSAVVPADHKEAVEYTERFGWTLEGVIRQGVHRADGDVDLNYYGFLRAELDNDAVITDGGKEVDDGLLGSSSTIHSDRIERPRRWFGREGRAEGGVVQSAEIGGESGLRRFESRHHGELRESRNGWRAWLSRIAWPGRRKS